ncbi:hypothetical protein Slala02_76530 [Streptomyces lavendulae subsp. lavendulae]|nr:hypothetical protein Slala01_76100 [Streptomyces lavendulae subsp. lavendulae]GLX31834.1 hypothetical protein Slala02_76530 [Streptomyces lavendulae subsp. lavendulae]
MRVDMRAMEGSLVRGVVAVRTPAGRGHGGGARCRWDGHQVTDCRHGHVTSSQSMARIQGEVEIPAAGAEREGLGVGAQWGQAHITGAFVLSVPSRTLDGAEGE